MDEIKSIEYYRTEIAQVRTVTDYEWVKKIIIYSKDKIGHFNTEELLEELEQTKFNGTGLSDYFSKNIAQAINKQEELQIRKEKQLKYYLIMIKNKKEIEKKENYKIIKCRNDIEATSCINSLMEELYLLGQKKEVNKSELRILVIKNIEYEIIKEVNENFDLTNYFESDEYWNDKQF